MNETISFCGEQICLRPTGALYWPSADMLVVSDLHLGKSERIARRGGTLLPPYETTETLTRLSDEIDATQATTVLCLGDSFDDRMAAEALDDAHIDTLQKLKSGRRWLWVEGNHDPGPLGLGGTHLSEKKKQHPVKAVKYLVTTTQKRGSNTPRGGAFWSILKG